MQINFNILRGESPSVDLWDRVLRQFEIEAAPIAISGVQEVLGTDLVFALSPGYAEHKSQDPRYVMVPGKDPGQPLILSANLYHNIIFTLENGVFYLSVAEGAGLDPETGVDYAALWEARVQFLELGIDLVMDQLNDLFLNILIRELGI